MNAFISSGLIKFKEKKVHNANIGWRDV